MLTVDEAAERLRCHPATIRRMIQRGDLEHVKVGRVYRIPPDAIRTRRAPVAEAVPRAVTGKLARLVLRESPPPSAGR